MLQGMKKLEYPVACWHWVKTNDRRIMQFSPSGTVNKIILKPRLALAARDFPDVKFHVAAQLAGSTGKAAKFRSLYDIAESNPVPASGLGSKVNHFVHVPPTSCCSAWAPHYRVSNFVESSFESSFELLEFVNDDILLQQRFSIFAYNYVVHLHISSA